MRRLATHLAAALAALSAAGSEWIGSPPLDQADREWRSEVAAKAVRPAFLSSRHVGLAFDLSPLSLVSARDFESGREMASPSRPLVALSWDGIRGRASTDSSTMSFKASSTASGGVARLTFDGISPAELVRVVATASIGEDEWIADLTVSVSSAEPGQPARRDMTVDFPVAGVSLQRGASKVLVGNELAGAGDLARDLVSTRPALWMAASYGPDGGVGKQYGIK